MRDVWASQSEVVWEFQQSGGKYLYGHCHATIKQLLTVVLLVLLASACHTVSQNNEHCSLAFCSHGNVPVLAHVNRRKTTLLLLHWVAFWISFDRLWQTFPFHTLVYALWIIIVDPYFLPIDSGSNLEGGGRYPRICTCDGLWVVWEPILHKLYECCSFIDTNLIHNFLYKLHKIKFLYMSPLSKCTRDLQRMRIPEAEYMYN